jgi:RNA polymerase sigma-70 factor (ECF subfamily)
MVLVERCRSGDLAAFEELYRAHAGKLFSVACRMLGNPADAEDLLQEIFLSAHRKLDGFRGESALGTWLYRLATNHCLDYLRSRAARTNQLTDALDDEPGHFQAGSPGLAEQTVTKMDLERALARLPEGCRAAFVLHDVQGLEHREVAQALGIAEGTSKSQVHKARLRLRALLLEQRVRPDRDAGG